MNNSVNRLKRTEALANFLVAELIYLYLVVEEILVDNKFKKNIFSEPLFILRNINSKILNFKKISHNFQILKLKLDEMILIKYIKNISKKFG